MPNSLRVKLSKLRYKGEITQEEYAELIKKLEGHNKQIRAEVLDEYKQELKQDINSRLKSVEKYLEGETLDAWRQATRTFKDAIDYFSEQLKEKK